MNGQDIPSKLALDVAPDPGRIPDFSEWSEAVRLIETSIEEAIDHE